jgi:hypothetical protein
MNNYQKKKIIHWILITMLIVIEIVISAWLFTELKKEMEQMIILIMYIALTISITSAVAIVYLFIKISLVETKLNKLKKLKR